MNGVWRTGFLPLGVLMATGALSCPAAELAKAPATGHVYLTVTEHSRLSQLDEVCRRLDIDLQSKSLAPALKATANQYDPSKEKLEAFIPPNYQPQTPHGLLVWAGVGPLSPAWFEVFTRHKLIAVSANPANAAVGFSRLRLPLDAVPSMRSRYNVDENRIYISGFSAGAGVAAQLVCGFPDMFRGGLFLMGGRFCLTHKNERGRYEPTLEMIVPKEKAKLDQLKRDMPFVFMRAQGDTQYSPQEDAAQYHALLLDGFQNAAFIVTPGGHRPPDGFWFEQGLKAMESPRAQVSTTQPVQVGPLGPAGHAQRLLATAQLVLERKAPSYFDTATKEKYRKSNEDKAGQYLRQILNDYASTPAAAKARQVLSGL